MIKSACKLMKKVTTSSVSLILVGGFLVFLSHLLTLNSTLPAIISYLGFIAIFAGIVVMLITLIAIMIPTVNQSLQQCQH